jgi:hypothetical protein
MDDNLVGYLLNALDDDTHQQVEEYLRDNPKAQKRLESLRATLEPLAADKDDIAPSAGLAFRTLARVAEYRCRPVPEPSPAPVIPSSSGWAERPWWRRTDVLVAASIFLVVGTLCFQGFSNFKATAARLECANNLANFHYALNTYSDRNDGYLPGVPLRRDPVEPWKVGPQPIEVPENPLPPNATDREVAGIFIVQLKDSGCLGPMVSIQCPTNGKSPPSDKSLQDLQNMSLEEFDKEVARLVRCYAYSLGYRGPAGEHRGLRRDPDQPDLNNDLLPVMADRPFILPDGTRVNSRNHKGQNVLFMGGNVRYCTSPNVGIDGDDIYVNRNGKVAAGLDWKDTVLGCSGDRP